jgi:hypothetical protein
VLPFYALPFGLWFIKMNPGFIPSDDAIQEVVTFTTVPLQKDGSRCPDSCSCAPLSDVWAPALQKLCGTQDCHALNNRPNLD